jgi:hypothetical protein
MNRIIVSLAARPRLAGWLLALVGLVLAACSNSGGKPGY